MCLENVLSCTLQWAFRNSNLDVSSGRKWWATLSQMIVVIIKVIANRSLKPFRWTRYTACLMLLHFIHKTSMGKLLIWNTLPRNKLCCGNHFSMVTSILKCFCGTVSPETCPCRSWVLVWRLTFLCMTSPMKRAAFQHQWLSVDFNCHLVAKKSQYSICWGRFLSE